jgi:hypothetical protein
VAPHNLDRRSAICGAERGARPRCRHGPIVSRVRTTLDTITPGRTPDRVCARFGTSASLVSPPLGYEAGMCAVCLLWQARSAARAARRGRALRPFPGPVSSSARRSGRSAPPDRVSPEAGFGRSCAQGVGGHTPLQVSLDGEPDRVRGVRSTASDPVGGSPHRLRQAQPAKVYALPRPRHTTP